MPRFIRRSLLLVDMPNMSLSEDVLGAKSDALILDFEMMPLGRRSTLAGSDMLSVLTGARESAAEAFVRLRHDTVHRGLETAVWPGLAGVVLTNVEHAEEVEEVSKHLTELERQRGIPVESLQIIVEIGTATGVWNSLDIARSSARLAGLSVGETSLCHDLGLDVEARLGKDPLRFIKAQIIVNARAAGLQAQGMSYPLSITLEPAEESVLNQAVRQARDMGFKGAICPHISWVKACNEGFRPNDDEVAYYRKVRELFADGTRRGLASVPFEGRMIDVPVDRRAQAFLEWAELCTRRDAEKA